MNKMLPVLLFLSGLVVGISAAKSVQTEEKPVEKKPPLILFAGDLELPEMHFDLDEPGVKERLKQMAEEKDK